MILICKLQCGNSASTDAIARQLWRQSAANNFPSFVIATETAAEIEIISHTVDCLDSYVQAAWKLVYVIGLSYDVLRLTVSLWLNKQGTLWNRVLEELMYARPVKTFQTFLKVEGVSFTSPFPQVKKYITTEVNWFNVASSIYKTIWRIMISL